MPAERKIWDIFVVAEGRNRAIRLVRQYEDACRLLGVSSLWIWGDAVDGRGRANRLLLARTEMAHAAKRIRAKARDRNFE